VAAFDPSQEVPSTWNESDIAWVSEAWFNNQNFFRAGTGYRGVTGVLDEIWLLISERSPQS